MTIFYIIDYTDCVDKFTVCRDCLKSRRAVCCDPSGSRNNFQIVQTDSLRVNWFLVDLRCFRGYRLLIANAIVSFLGDNNNNRKTSNQKLGIKLHPPAREPLDYAWGERANQMMWERIELDEMMSWLSTLGGAFSALGDYKLACADVAGKISVQQMKLATRLGEPTVVARCRLYMAIAMTQKYNFSGAKQIVKEIYQNEKKQTEPDGRLLKMCLGIWSKLSYEYEMYQKKLNRVKV